MDTNDDNVIDPELRAIYSGKNDEWLIEAQGNLKEYLELALRIYERISEDPVAYAKFREELQIIEGEIKTQKRKTDKERKVA